MARQDASALGVDFHLPDEILAVIPTDPYEQLDVVRKITSMAITSRVSRLEADVARLRRDLADRDRAKADLRTRLAETDARLHAALDENAKLAKERDSLAATAKKLARNLAKLEAFKKQLMKSLSEDNLLQLSETGQDHDTEDSLGSTTHRTRLSRICLIATSHEILSHVAVFFLVNKQEDKLLEQTLSFIGTKIKLSDISK